MGYNKSTQLDSHSLLPLVKVEQKLHNNCAKHKKTGSMFCLDCKGNPICIMCLDEETNRQHENHNFLQVFRSTYKYAVRFKDIKAYMTEDDIHKLKNNGDIVCFILSRGPQKGGYHSTGRHCIACGFKLSAGALGARFCSIQCKIESVPPVSAPTIGHCPINIQFRQIPSNPSSSLSIDRQSNSSFQEVLTHTSSSIPPHQHHPSSFRKAPRKRRPCRSPLN